MGKGAMRSMAWCVILLLAVAAAAAHAAPGSPPPRMPDPCIAAPNLPFCN
jgi:hypothetical protein